ALDAVPGLGPKRQAALLRQFGSVRALTEAEVTEIAQVPGIGPALAATVSAALRGSTAADAQRQDMPSSGHERGDCARATPDGPAPLRCWRTWTGTWWTTCHRGCCSPWPG